MLPRNHDFDTKHPEKSTTKTYSNPAIPAGGTSDAVAVMFTFSFGSAFAATNAQTGVYDKQDRTDELYFPAAYQANVSATGGAEFGEYGITEAYKAELAKEWGKVLKNKADAVVVGNTQAADKFKINATNYYAVEKAEAKELITAAIESFKTATTAADARNAETNLVTKLNKLLKTAVDAEAFPASGSVTKANYLADLDVSMGTTLSQTVRKVYLLPEYGYLTAEDLDKADAVKVSTLANSAVTGVTDSSVIYDWFLNKGYRTLTDAKAHVAEFKAALVPLTADEIKKIQAEYDAINAKNKAAKDAFSAANGYGVANVEGVDLAGLDALYAEREAYEEKYAVSTASTDFSVGADPNKVKVWQAWTNFAEGSSNTQGFLVYVYANQYASEIKSVDLTNEDAVVALVDKIDEAKKAFKYITITDPASSKEYAALTKAYKNFQKDAENALATVELGSAFTRAANGKVYFDNAEKNVKALEANRAAYDRLAKKYAIYNDALEAKILAGEHNKAVVVGYDEKIDKIDTSKVQAYLNNATVKVTTKALGNNKIRVNARIDATSFNYILGEMTDGCTVRYKFYHKKAGAAAYKASKVKDRNYITYTKASLKKGTKYKFQCEVTIKDIDGKVVATKSYKASTVGSRICR